jgi:hypothetical protein
MTVFSATEAKVVEDTILRAKVYFDMPFALKTAGADVTVTKADFERSNPSYDRLRGNRKFSNPFKLILAVQSHAKKESTLRRPQISSIIRPSRLV